MNDDDDLIHELMRRVAAQDKRIEELEGKTYRLPPPMPKSDGTYRPPNPIDYVGMSPEVMRQMAEAIPTDMVRQIVGDGGVGVL